MARGAAQETALGAVHLKITKLFQKVLDRYEQRLDALEDIDRDELETEFLEELFQEGAIPNPAMLSAITKFLKDNDIGFDTDEIDELSAQERRLAERREKRKNLTTLTDLRVVENG